MRQSTLVVKDLLKGPLTVAEIGVCTGFNAMSILSELDVKMIYLVDPYESYNDGNEHLEEPEMARHLFMMTRPMHHKVCIVRYPSEFVSTFFPSRFFDYVYIDGLHTYEGVKVDCEKWYPLVREGGVLAGHDYGTPHIGVKKAVDEFTNCANFSSFKVFRDSDWMVVK